MVKTTIIAGLLSAILGGEYNAKTLSIAEQDSILNDGISASLNEGMSNRYRLESENEQKSAEMVEQADRAMTAQPPEQVGFTAVQMPEEDLPF